MMKKKVLVITLTAAMLATAIGCGSNSAGSEAGVVSETTATVEAEESAVTEDAAEEMTEEIVAEPIPTVNVSISETGYTDLAGVNEEYIIFGSGEKYGLMDKNGVEVFPADWDYYTTGFQDGSFAMGRKIDDMTCEYVLFDKNAVEIFRNDSFPEFYVESYHEDVIHLTELSPEDGIAVNLYLDAATQDIIFATDESSFEGYYGASSVNDNYITIRCTVCNNDYKFPNLFHLEMGEVVHGPKMWMAFPFAVTDSGYINGSLYDEETMRVLCYAMYNVKTEELVELPEEIYSTKTLKTDGVRVTATEDGYLAVDSEEDGPLAIYSLTAKDYVSEYKYDYVGMYAHNKEPYVLVSNVDGTEWGYLDSDMQEVGTWYSDATDFSNGLAMIQDVDGLYYATDASFEKMTEGIEGDGAYSLNYMYGYFAIQRGDLYYLVKVG